MKHIDHTYYINLDKREDRNKHTLKTVIPFFKLEEGDYTRFSAVDTSSETTQSLRSIGCAQSHLNIYQDAKEKGYRHILILEDDFVPVIEQDLFFENLDYLFNKIPYFNICQIAYNDIKRAIPYGEPNSPVLFSPNVQTTSAYIANVSFLDVIKNTISDSINKLKQGHPSTIHAIDQCWKKFQSLDYQWFLLQRAGVQADDYSDIEAQHVQYNC